MAGGFSVKRLCDRCRFEVSAANFKRHVFSCDGSGPKGQTYVQPEFYICKHCSKEFTRENKQGYCSHSRVCGEISHGTWRHPMTRSDGSKRTPWCKGLTKHDDSRLRVAGEKISESQTGKKRGPMTIPHREAISIGRTKFLHSGLGHLKYYDVLCGTRIIKVQGTWEKLVAEYLNTKGYTWDRFSLYYDGHRRYTPDFWVEDLKLFLEVKGWLRPWALDKMTRALTDNPELDLRVIGREELQLLTTDGMALEDLPRLEEYTARLAKWQPQTV